MKKNIILTLFLVFTFFSLMAETILIDVTVKQPKGENEELFVFAANGSVLDTVMPIKVEGNHYYFDYSGSCCIIAQSKKYEPAVVYFIPVTGQKEASVELNISKKPKKDFKTREEEEEYLHLKMKESMPFDIDELYRTHKVIRVRSGEMVQD